MRSYSNREKYSGIYAYEIGPDHIKVLFRDGALYKYTYASAGRSNIEAMKQLAISGVGLNRYINTHVKRSYVKL
jgi:hypothetical protein